MATKELVTKVWIDPGCIVCDACETACPEVFEVKPDDGTCIIRPDALDADFTKALTATIIEAADECPVDVIKFETLSAEVSAEEAAAAPAPAASVEDKTPAPAAAKAHPAAPAPSKPAEAERPKITDPAIQALLEAATARGGKAGMDKPILGAAVPLKRLQNLPVDQLPPDARYQMTLAKSKPAKAGEITRRDWALAAGWLFTAAGLGGSTHAFARFMMPNVLEEPDPRVRVAPLSKFKEMKPGDVNADYKDSGKFWIIREETRIAAVSIVCTHLGCVPSWLQNDRKFKCPCHGSGFMPNGVNFEGPAPRPLERFKLLLDGDIVIVDRSKKFLAMGPNDICVWDDPEASITV
ncbi:MAG: Rieske 2Fe-2S domain-containing protein [Phycisphaerae bacterium]